MGTYLPPKFSSILEPNRHFASLKVPAAKDITTVVGISDKISDDLIPSVYLQGDASTSTAAGTGTGNGNGNSPDVAAEDLVNQKLLHVMVLTSDGFFYKFGLDPERGGDCVLLNQRSLIE
ncbi:unnamed protein product [Ambrosiozyma monospora]|uniref:Unnamed protein product n=1 Tax=Ambrosiozyma monospora TaxID=43982 RepID=A0ACB5UCE9_AMBMO|nr:unnamed protein product [Ambrosiozyma monospora]